MHLYRHTQWFGYSIRKVKWIHIIKVKKKKKIIHMTYHNWYSIKWNKKDETKIFTWETNDVFGNYLYP